MADDFIPLCVPYLRGNESVYLQECVETNWVSYAGPFVDRFEKQVADYVGQAHAVATASGTAALHVALLLAGVEAGDEVILPDITFIASANAVRYLHAWPVFIDVEPTYWQMDVEKLADFLHHECTWRSNNLVNSRTGRRVRAIMPVHILGHPVDMDPLMELAARHELAVIEDATESLGARYKGCMVGTLGHAACFSFNGNKLLTTGGGGMIVTGREDWARRGKHLTTQAKTGTAEFIHDEVGYNYRLTNFQAAVGVAQMEQIDGFLAAKQRIAKTYSSALASLPGWTMPSQAPWADSTFWMYTCRVDASAFGRSARDVVEHLEQHRIQSRPLWQPMHLSPAMTGCLAHGIEIAEHLWQECISLPCSVGLTEAQQSRVTATLHGLASITT